MATQKDPSSAQSLPEFFKRFPDDAACWTELVAIRWPKGKSCMDCRNAMGFVQTRRVFQCNRCHRQASATAGTVFHQSHISLQKWFSAIFLMATSSRGISMLNLQKRLGIKSYRAAWLIGHKIRQAMIQKLNGKLHGDPLKIGGAGKEVPRFVTFEQLASGFTREILPALENRVARRSALRTDAAGAGLISTYHGCFPKYRTAYLAEFSYRYTRRGWPYQAFDRLLAACIQGKRVTLKTLRSEQG